MSEENNKKDEPKYFAAKDADKTANILLTKADDWFNRIELNGYLDKIRQMWLAYHGAFYQDIENSHNITFSGEQGELANISVNHIRNIATNMKTLITSSRPSMQARSINTDYKSLVQTKLANGLLDYYLREKKLENYLDKAVEYALVLGSGYVKMEWNETAGEVYDFNEETGVEIREGDIEFSNLSPFDVVFDGNREDSNHDWVICRSFKNKFDLAAKYPEYKSKIEKMQTKDQVLQYHFTSSTTDDTDLIPVYEFYHKRTEAMEDGRYMLFLSDSVTLIDSPMPYRDLPVYRITPGEYLGTPYGYSPLFDLLPIQDALNSSYSTILTNHNAFGVSNVVVPRGADINVDFISGGLNIIEGNFTNGKPESLNLTQTPKEIFDFMQILERQMETISGINAVARGNPPSNLKSGNAMALMTSMSIQYMSGLQRSYVQLIEDVGTGLINVLKDFASVPKIAMISGKSNKTEMKEFTGDDLSSINRVIVDIGNPLSRCLAKGTPVLMHDGSIQEVQDIRPGELVMGPDSMARTVESIANGFETMYKVSSKDKNRGISYTCNESHILTLKYCSDDNRYNAKKGDILDISIRDYLKLPNRQKRLLQGFTTGVEFDKKEVEVPGYILGAWLGDGHSACTALTTMDDELVAAWKSYADSINMQIRKQDNRPPNKSSVYFITSGKANGRSDRNPFMNELKSMELINNKHIPKIYLNNSSEVRLEVLAGLLDTDGYLNGETFLFTQKNDRLAKDVVYLAKSLGFRVTSKKRKSSSSELVGEIEGEVNVISIGGDTHRIPTKLARKQAKKKEKARNWLNYGIEVECLGQGEYFGFTLKEEPHFLLGDFTVTHNTTAGKVEMAEQMLQMGIIKTPEQYFTVINTGKLDSMTEDTQSELLLIRSENERLVDQKPVVAVATDQHSLHIKEHRAVLADPELRFNPELVQATLDHIQEHLDLLRATDPNMLTMIQEQPLGPVGGSPIAQAPGQAPAPSNVPGEMPEPMDVSGQMNVQDQMNMPNLPNPPGEFANAPVVAPNVPFE